MKNTNKNVNKCFLQKNLLKKTFCVKEKFQWMLQEL